MKIELFKLVYNQNALVELSSLKLKGLTRRLLIKNIKMIEEEVKIFEEVKAEKYKENNILPNGSNITKEVNEDLIELLNSEVEIDLNIIEENVFDDLEVSTATILALDFFIK